MVYWSGVKGDCSRYSEDETRGLGSIYLFYGCHGLRVSRKYQLKLEGGGDYEGNICVVC